MYSLGFLGAGWMGGALMEGITKCSEDTACLFFEISEERKKALYDTLGIRAEASVADLMKKANATVIAVKPQIYPEVVSEIKANYTSDKLLISIMAGISLATLGKELPSDAKIIRLMPNMAMTVQAGVCLMSVNENVTAEEKERVKAILSPLGLVKEIPERLMDAGTAVSGSGPAFFYSMVEAMMLGGVRAGFTKADAEELSVWTMYGASCLLRETQNSPGALRDQMMSAGGTTVEGVCALEQGSFRGDVIEAVSAACRRSKELSKGDK